MIPEWEPSDAELEEAGRFSDADGGCVATGWRCRRCGSLDARVLLLEPPNGARVACVGCSCERRIEF